MAFPTTPVLDAFNTGANQFLTARAGWGATPLGGGLSFSTNGTPTQALPTTTASNYGNFWNTASADSECYLTLTTWSPAGNSVRICARVTATGSSATYYALELAATTTTGFQLCRLSAGTKTLLGSNLPTTVASGDSVGISVVGTTVTAWHKVGAGAWTQKITLTDATIAGSGRIGTHRPAGNISHAFDNFGGGAPVPSGTVFTQSISGSALFSGTRPVVAAQRRLPGVLAFSGSEVSHPTARRVTASFTPAGSLSRQLSLLRTLAGALSFTGTRTAASAYARSLVGAVFAPVGSQTRVKAVSKAVAGALSFTGSQSHQARKQHAATLTPTGNLNRSLSFLRSLPAGSLSFAGVVKRSTNHRLAGAASWVGMVITNSLSNHLAAVFRPTAGAVTHGLPARTLFAGFQATSTLAKFTSRQLVSSLIASGVIHTQYLPPVPAGQPGGGGYGALMSDAHFRRYNVVGAWRNVKRVKA